VLGLAAYGGYKSKSVYMIVCLDGYAYWKNHRALSPKIENNNFVKCEIEE
jgi:hypothetical protein